MKHRTSSTVDATDNPRDIYVAQYPPDERYHSTTREGSPLYYDDNDLLGNYFEL